MAKLYNLARMTTATTGTGTITLGSAVSSYVTFASAGVQNGDTVTYAIVDGSNREVGRGVYTSTGTTLTRATILESTNSNLAINLSGSAEVFITAAAEDITSSVEITGGSITGITDLAIADGGTGASNAAGARTNLGVAASGANTDITSLNLGAGSASAPSLSTTGDTNTGIFFPAADTIAFSTNGTEDFRIGSSGQLGIGGANYGTSGQVLTSGGSGSPPSWATPSSGGGTVSLLDTQTFNSSGTWSKSGIPSNAKFVIVVGWGAGGSGSKASTQNQGAGGGGGGAYHAAFFDYSALGATQSVTVGAGGAARSGGQAGASGGASSFSTFTANGGNGGSADGSATSGGSSPPMATPSTRRVIQSTSVNPTTLALTSDYTIFASATPSISNAAGGNGGTGSGGTSGGAGAGQSTSFSGAGGGGYGNQSGAGGSGPAAGAGGTATNGGGNGGAGAISGNATAGSQPGGGGGAFGAVTGSSGAGGAGRVIVYTYG